MSSFWITSYDLSPWDSGYMIQNSNYKMQQMIRLFLQYK